ASVGVHGMGTCWAVCAACAFWSGAPSGCGPRTRNAESANIAILIAGCRRPELATECRQEPVACLTDRSVFIVSSSIRLRAVYQVRNHPQPLAGAEQLW